MKKNPNFIYCLFFILLINTKISANDNLINQFELFDRNVSTITYSKGIEKNPFHITNNNHYLYIKPSRNLIDKLRKDFSINYKLNSRIEAEINFIKKNDNYMLQVLKRSTPFLAYIVSELKKRNMPVELALLPIIESSYDPFAYSIGQAAGLWQMIPITASRFGIEQNWWYDGRRDLIDSTEAAMEYLSYLYGYMGEDWLLALASYNSGEGSISRAIQKNKNKSLPWDFWNLSLSRQTSAYVPRLLALIEIIKYPKKYNIELPVIANEIYFSIVDVEGQIDLALAAELAEIELKQLYILNAGNNRWASSPNGPHKLLIPKNKVAIFSQALIMLPKGQRLRWKRHLVEYGETLSEIAEQYNTTSNQIKVSNDLTSSSIQSNSYLMIPVAHKELNTYESTSDQRLISKQNRKRIGQRIEHIISRGESLWLIARKYKVEIDSLSSWNNMSPKDVLSIGNKLVIWTNQTTVNNKPIQRKLNYVVKNGDSLYLIAKKFRVTIVDLARWNNLDQEKILQPNQRLIIYIDVTKQSS